MANISIIVLFHVSVAKMAEMIKKCINSTGSIATIYQVQETLPYEILQKMYAPEKPSYPIATTDVLVNCDGVMFEVPTRFFSMPA